MCKNYKNIGNYIIKELFKQNFKIPDFQRPYSWNKGQVEQLINDLLQAQKQDKIYLIGNMILYQQNNELKIIDGQQRITTLALLFNVLGEEVEFLEEKINILSAKKLKENYEILKNRFANFQNKENFLKFLQEKVIITYIKTDDLDEAFVLFDSQNTRGEPLKRKDILKVHHIHPISNNRKIYAKKWEEWEKKKITNNKDELDELLYLLCLARKGITNRLIADDFIEIDIFEELKTKISNTKYLKLNNYNQPPIYQTYDFDFEKNTLNLITKPLQYLKDKIYNGSRYIPFEINSAIVGGDKFFMFVYKYFELYKKILQNKYFNINVSGSGNLYLKKFYQTVILFYYDKFEDENLKEFIERLLILIAYLRLISHSIRKETIYHQEWNRKTKLNIFSLIRNSYSNYEILEDIDNYIRFEIDTVNEAINEDTSGVKADYKKVFESFFGSLKEKIKDIKDGK